MFILRFLWAVITSRFLWTLIGIALLSLLIWVFGPIVQVGPYAPFESDKVRIAIIAGLIILWLIWLIIAQRRAIRANRMFVAEISAPVAEKQLTPGEESVAAVGAKFGEVMAELKRRKLGGRKFLREMPWYVIVGPPATGKTTALRQSGLNFPIDLTDDLQGIGGTRNCDWFFSENAVMIDTAGRYVQQESQPDVDAAECRDRLIDNLLRTLFLAHVRGHGQHSTLSPDLSQTTARFLQGVWRAGTDDDTASLSDKRSGAGKPQSLARAGYDSHTIFQSEVHSRR